MSHPVRVPTAAEVDAIARAFAGRVAAERIRRALGEDREQIAGHLDEPPTDAPTLGGGDALPARPIRIERGAQFGDEPLDLGDEREDGGGVHASPQSVAHPSSGSASQPDRPTRTGTRASTAAVVRGPQSPSAATPTAA